MLPHYCGILAAAAPRIFRPFFPVRRLWGATFRASVRFDFYTGVSAEEGRSMARICNSKLVQRP